MEDTFGGAPEAGTAGPAFVPVLDSARLIDQHGRIKRLMADAVWRTLDEIAHAADAPAASVSAQLRHLRKPAFGRHVVEKRRRGEASRGLWEYRVLPPKVGGPL